VCVCVFVLREGGWVGDCEVWIGVCEGWVGLEPQMTIVGVERVIGVPFPLADNKNPPHQPLFTHAPQPPPPPPVRTEYRSTDRSSSPRLRSDM